HDVNGDSAPFEMGQIKFADDENGGNADATIETYATGDHNSGDNPTEMQFYTTPDESDTLTKALELQTDQDVNIPNGNLLISSPSSTDDALEVGGEAEVNSLGIGNDAGGTALDINDGGYPQHRVESGDDGEAGIRLRTQHSGNHLHADIAVDATGNSKGRLEFKVPFDNSEGANGELNIDHNGNVKIPNGNLGVLTTTPLSGVSNEGIHLDAGGHGMIKIGDGVNNGGYIQASDTTPRLYLGVNTYDDESNSWQIDDTSDTAAALDISPVRDDRIAFLIGDGDDGYPVTALEATANQNVNIPNGDLDVSGDCTEVDGACADIAEVYNASEPVHPGEIVAVDTGRRKTVEAAGKRERSNVVGVVTTAPAILFE
ncbi:MAG: hypothetical protein ABEI52_04990, partial [Halobacteriaceae archaeon]